jgi:hypothetical protein
LRSSCAFFCPMCCLVQPRFTASIRPCASPSTCTSLGGPRWLPASCDVFHHAQAKQVEVEIRYDDEFRLASGTTERALMRRFSRATVSRDTMVCAGCANEPHLSKGKLAVWSEVNEGTEVELRVPASAAYTTDHKPSWLRKLLRRHEPGSHIICYQAARR